jgi:uncharacterized repeat protein (TIGR03803 family)
MQLPSFLTLVWGRERIPVFGVARWFPYARPRNWGLIQFAEVLCFFAHSCESGAWIHLYLGATPKGVAVKNLPFVKTACMLFALCAATAINGFAQTQIFEIIFWGTNGEYPVAPLVQGTDGNLYGTTSSEGGGGHGSGTVFRVTPSGTMNAIHTFCEQSSCTDGAYPASGLALATDGNLYGTTNSGGANGAGTVYRITPDGKFSTLYSFCPKGNCNDGALPGGLIQATNGNLFGTTSSGGSKGEGTIFEMTLEGTLTTLHTFCEKVGCTDGAVPLGTLVEGSDGNFYGTTNGGGANNNRGTVFKMTPAGTFTTLYSFCAAPNCADGAAPYAGLVQGANGNFYGTTAYGGADIGICKSEGCGTVFEITPLGKLTNLHTFCENSSYCSDGEVPIGALMLATNGNFYGTTAYGGGDGGDIFEMTPTGGLAPWCDFGGGFGVGPATPQAGVVQGTDGNLFGTSENGGIGIGDVFGFSSGLAPFVETLPTTGKAGTTVMILGNNLTGSTSVTFDGISALFTAASDTEITATVPAGAATGLVEVTTPSGTLNSNVAFRVTQ